MSNTERYRHQHAEIARLAENLSKRLAPAALAADATEVRTILSELSGKLPVHLAAEDNLLYPRLLEAPEPATRAVAQRFLDEMGPLAQAFKSYAVRWGSARAIQSDAGTFAIETQSILRALNERIRREHSELYALADAL